MDDRIDLYPNRYKKLTQYKFEKYYVLFSLFTRNRLLLIKVYNLQYTTYVKTKLTEGKEVLNC